MSITTSLIEDEEKRNKEDGIRSRSMEMQKNMSRSRECNTNREDENRVRQEVNKCYRN